MEAEFPVTIAFVAVHLTKIAAEKQFAFDDLGMEQGGGGDQKGQKKGKYSETFHLFSICIL